MMDYYGWNGMSGGNVVGLIFSIVLLAAIVAAVIAVVRAVQGGGYRDGGPKSPEDVLKMRYAKGEITKREFEEMKKSLSG